MNIIDNTKGWRVAKKVLAFKTVLKIRWKSFFKYLTLLIKATEIIKAFKVEMNSSELSGRADRLKSLSRLSLLLKVLEISFNLIEKLEAATNAQSLGRDFHFQIKVMIKR